MVTPVLRTTLSGVSSTIMCRRSCIGGLQQTTTSRGRWQLFCMAHELCPLRGCLRLQLDDLLKSGGKRQALQNNCRLAHDSTSPPKRSLNADAAHLPWFNDAAAAFQPVVADKDLMLVDVCPIYLDLTGSPQCRLSAGDFSFGDGPSVG